MRLARRALSGHERYAPSRKIAAALAIIFCASLGGSGLGQADVQASNVVTAEIQAGIEKYIEKQTERGGGFFKFSSGGKEYLFKLVRVHTEYLARLGPRRHFACVDLVDTSGDIYDVDFFMSGDPGAMSVTETTLHKLNGIPFYAWEQDPKGGWQRVPAKDASPRLLGVIKRQDEFEFRYRAIFPKITGRARMWLPFPETDAFQTVEIESIDSPQKYRTLQEPRYGNKAFFFELEPEDGGKTVDIRYRVKRIEKAAYSPHADDSGKYLEAERLVPINDHFKNIAKKIVEGKKGDLVRARALYDHVIDRMRYMKYGAGWGKGDAVYGAHINSPLFAHLKGTFHSQDVLIMQ